MFFFDIFSEGLTIKIKNISVDLHGENVFDRVINSYSNAFNLIQCNEIDKS